MTHIEYSAIHPKFTEFITSEEFNAVLIANPNLKLVRIEEDAETEEELFNPLPESFYDCVALMDRNDPDAFMWVLNDSYCIAKDPSPVFIDVLKVMDAYYAKTLNQRIFTREGQFAWLPVTEEEMLAVEYDFTTGEYLF